MEKTTEEKEAAIIENVLKIPFENWTYENEHYYQALIDGNRLVLSEFSQGCPKALWVDNILITDPERKMGQLFRDLEDSRRSEKDKKRLELINEFYEKLIQ